MTPQVGQLPRAVGPARVAARVRVLEVVEDCPDVVSGIGDAIWLADGDGGVVQGGHRSAQGVHGGLGRGCDPILGRQCFKFLQWKMKYFIPALLTS